MSQRKAFVTVGMGYGDEGKGQVVDHLVREHGAHTVMRYSGGAQAAHNVIAPDGRHHTFAQFGSGTFAGAGTYLGRDVMVNPLDMFNEYYHLASIGETDAWDRLAVNKACLVTTPIHEAANLLKEFYRRGRSHGTTGKGIGETRLANMRLGGFWVGVLGDKDRTKKKIEELIAYYKEQEPRWADHPATAEPEASWSDRLDAALDLLRGERPDLVEQMVDRYAEWSSRTKLVDNIHLSKLLSSGAVVLEGSQGVLLDESMGFHPHTTWSDVTPRRARTELMIAGLAGSAVETIGVVRSYTTRHGNGPFPSDTNRRPPRLHAEPRRTNLWFEEPHNAPKELGWFRPNLDYYEFGTAGEFRRSPFDAVAFRYAIGQVKPDAIALTHLDAFPKGEWPVVMSYEYFGDDGISRHLSTGGNGEVTGIKVGDISHMECVTRRLFDCYPNVEDVPLGNDPSETPFDIVNAVQAIGNVPVTIIGLGPRNYRTVG